MAPVFTPESLPDLTGRVYIVTGGNAGIGYKFVHYLATHNATVYIACRTPSKGAEPVTSIRETNQKGVITVLPLDLTSFVSVVAAAARIFLDNESTLHGLVNSAGIMATPYAVIDDGFETQIQTNYLSHWLLTYHLLLLMQKTAVTAPQGSVRIVKLSSMEHAAASGINFEDINLPDVLLFGVTHSRSW